jgi:hypothetical protein
VRLGDGVEEDGRGSLVLRFVVVFSFLSFLSFSDFLLLSPPSSPAAVDMPEGDGLMGLMDAMKYDSQMVLLNPEEKGMMMMPVGSSLFPLSFPFTLVLSSLVADSLPPFFFPSFPLPPLK